VKLPERYRAAKLRLQLGLEARPELVHIQQADRCGESNNHDHDSDENSYD